MSTVFPVEVEFFSTTGEKISTSLLQAFTRDVGAGGMCLELKSFGKSTEKLFEVSEHLLELTINPTFLSSPIKAKARIAWRKKQEAPLPQRYLLGVAYTQIDEAANRRVMRYANNLIWMPRLAATAGIVLLVSLGALFFHDQKLIAENKALVRQTVESAQTKSDISESLSEFKTRKAKLESDLSAARQKISALESSIASLTAENEDQKKTYEKELSASLLRQRLLSGEIQSVESDTVKLKDRYESLENSSPTANSQALEQMVGWLKSHQNIATGLLASFEGDASLANQAFSYDQALAAQALLIFGDKDGADKILSFFKDRASRDRGAFFNSYGSVDGQPIENAIHVGPNVWIGIAALQYDAQTGEEKFLSLASSIGDWLLSQQDTEGGLRGGPGVSWYSVEHNLDAYAFFGMLAQVSSDDKYRQAQGRVLEWIQKYAYSLKEKRMNRGKGDATIATDTFSWAISAIGPAKLNEIQFDPEAIMDFAENHCLVTVEYEQPSGKIAKAKGFDFAKAQNLGRGGIISTEWTAQMIVAYQGMAAYFDSIGNADKASIYRQKSDFYLNELQKMMIASPSATGQGRGCLPYASVDNVDTGHGWRTPKGKRTGSVAGTAYGLFAWKNYNPFHLEK